MAANEDLLGKLHDMTATALMVAMEGTPILNEDGEEVGRMMPTAAVMQAAAKFLKDNNITCAPSEDNKMGELRDALDEKNKRREQRRATRAELAEASKEAGFLHGLPN